MALIPAALEIDSSISRESGASAPLARSRSTNEHELGTMENLLALPATGAEIRLGDIMPFFIVGAVQVVVLLAPAKALFGAPLVGGLGLPTGSILIFVCALVLSGDLFSTFARTQMQAMQLAFFFFPPRSRCRASCYPLRACRARRRRRGRSFRSRGSCA